MPIDPLNRQISYVAAVFAFVGVVLGVVALSTNYWTINQQATPGTALQISNGTLLTSDNIVWTWNVSSFSTNLYLNFVDMSFSGSFLSMYIDGNCFMFHSFLYNYIHRLFIGSDLSISQYNLYLLGFLQSYRSTICYSIVNFRCLCSINCWCL